MNKLFNLFLKYKLAIINSLFIALILLGLFNLFEDHFKYHIFVKFSKSGPLYKNMPVCFKGYAIGRTQKVTLSDDYKYTLVKIVLYPQNPKLPQKIDGVVKKHDVLGNYIDLIPSDESSTELLKNGDTIDGTPIFDLGTFLSEVAGSGLIVPLLQNFSDAALSLNKTSSKIGNFFSDSRLILKDNRQNLKHTTEALNKITSNFNSSFSKDKLNDTTSSVNKSATNIQAITENVKNITQSVDCATKNLDKTIAKIDCTASNVKIITGGFREVMSKKFAGLRIIFGQPLNKNKCPKNCSK